jgi:hypothetical protein
MSKCIPPAYWLYVAQALSESGMTTSAAILPLVEGNYHDALVFSDFHIDIPDRAEILGIQFETFDATPTTVSQSTTWSRSSKASPPSVSIAINQPTGPPRSPTQPTVEPTIGGD